MNRITLRSLLIALSALCLAYSTIPGRAQSIGATVGGVIGGVAGVAGTLRGTVAGTIGGGAQGLGGPLSGGAPGSGVPTGVVLNNFGVDGILSGPTGTITSSTMATFGGFSPREFGGFFNQANPASIGAAVALMARQRVVGQLVSASGATARIRLTDGSVRSLLVAPELEAALRAYLDRDIMLRSVDGEHVTSLVGRDDAVRGMVTAIDGNSVTFVDPIGETFVVSLAPQSRITFGVGARVVSESHDFGKSVRLSALALSPNSNLADVYVGSVVRALGNSITLRYGNTLQTFAADALAVRLAASLRGKVVALDSPDGMHVKSLLAAPMLRLVALGARAGLAPLGIRAAVLAAVSNTLTLQLPNGDVRSYVGSIVALRASARAAVVITPLDRYHVRVKIGARVARLADANACVTVNARCRGTMSGRVVAVSPGSVAVRLGNGDVATYLGNVTPLSISVGVPVIITPLDNVHARVALAGYAGNFVNANACVTINSGCHAMTGSISGFSKENIVVAFPDGTKTTLIGAIAALNVDDNLPAVVQPLDTTHAIVQVGGKVANVFNAQACVTINAMCLASYGPRSGAPGAIITGKVGTKVVARRVAAAACIYVGRGNACSDKINASGNGTGTGSGSDNRVPIASTGCVSINGSACTASGNNDVAGSSSPVAIGSPANGSTTPPNGPNKGNGAGAGADNGTEARFKLGDVSAPDSKVAAIGSMHQLASEPNNTCSQDGQVIVTVTDARTGKSLPNARVELIGPGGGVGRTGADGRIAFLRLPLGDYRAQVSRAGFKHLSSSSFRSDCTASDTLAFELGSGMRVVGKQSRMRMSVVAMHRTARIDRRAVRTMSAHRSTMCVSALQKARASRHHLAKVVRRRTMTCSKR